MKKNILIVDDDPNICKLLVRFLSKNGFEAQSCSGGAAAIDLLKDETFHLLLTDFRLPDMNGNELIQRAKVVNPALVIIMITGYSDVQIAVRAIKLGAYDYVTKPLHPDEILATIRKALSSKDTGSAVKREQHSNGKSNAAQNGKMASDEGSKYVFGDSPATKEVLRYIGLVAPTDMTVVIQGETGTGKEYLARLIHEKSKRSKKPFVAIDCGALTKDLAASELFGHLKGAFTGAVSDKQGSFEYANGGTLFLDEIGNLSYEIQVQLLRALQERKISRVGSNEDINIDIRMIAATNEDLKTAVQGGGFREDLYHRINEFSISVPPIRSRKDDIRVYVDHFLQSACKELSKEVQQVDDEVMAVLERYPWHGNLREMKNAIKRAALLARSNAITLDCLPHEIVHHDFGKFDVDNGEIDLKGSAASAERKTILEALKMTNNNKTHAAKILKIDRKTLYNKLSEYHIDL